jgi:hypothetical protein
MGQRARPLQRRSFPIRSSGSSTALPPRIDAIESEERDLQRRIAGSDFYKEGAAAIKEALARVEQLRAERDALYARWEELEARVSNRAG